LQQHETLTWVPVQLIQSGNRHGDNPINRTLLLRAESSGKPLCRAACPAPGPGARPTAHPPAPPHAGSRPGSVPVEGRRTGRVCWATTAPRTLRPQHFSLNQACCTSTPSPSICWEPREHTKQQLTAGDSFFWLCNRQTELTDNHQGENRLWSEPGGCQLSSGIDTKGNVLTPRTSGVLEDAGLV